MRLDLHATAWICVLASCYDPAVSASAASGATESASSGPAGTGGEASADSLDTFDATTHAAGTGGATEAALPTGGLSATESGTTGSMIHEGSTTGPAFDDSSSSDSAVAYSIEWCRLQHPPTVAVDPDEVFVVYGRVYSPGLTDQTPDNDPAPELVAEFGWGPDGSDPAVDATWSWLPGTPSPDWNGIPVGQQNNDEYQVGMSIGSLGTWDYCARFSGDGGTTWTYCDLDGPLVSGYTPDQAGSAFVFGISGE